LPFKTKSIEYWFDENRLTTIKIIEEIKITNQNLLSTIKRSCTLFLRNK
jgi:hypothetical protein